MKIAHGGKWNAVIEMKMVVTASSDATISAGSFCMVVSS
jgi:hypothetical protein